MKIHHSQVQVVHEGIKFQLSKKATDNILNKSIFLEGEGSHSNNIVESKMNIVYKEVVASIAKREEIFSSKKLKQAPQEPRK